MTAALSAMAARSATPAVAAELSVVGAQRGRSLKQRLYGCCDGTGGRTTYATGGGGGGMSGPAAAPSPRRSARAEPDPQLLEFLQACMELDPAMRLTADQLLDLPYFDDVAQLVAASGSPTLYELLTMEVGKRSGAAAAAAAGRAAAGASAEAPEEAAVAAVSVSQLRQQQAARRAAAEVQEAAEVPQVPEALHDGVTRRLRASGLGNQQHSYATAEGNDRIVAGGGSSAHICKLAVAARSHTPSAAPTPEGGGTPLATTPMSGISVRSVATSVLSVLPSPPQPPPLHHPPQVRAECIRLLGGWMVGSDLFGAQLLPPVLLPKPMVSCMCPSLLPLAAGCGLPRSVLPLMTAAPVRAPAYLTWSNRDGFALLTPSRAYTGPRDLLW